MTAIDFLYKKCAEKDSCLLPEQVNWIVEAMEEYAKQELFTIMWKYGLDCATNAALQQSIVRPDEWLKNYKPCLSL